MELIFTVRVKYSEDVNPEEERANLESALEHCRQENMLSDPEQEASCDWVQVTAVQAER